MTLWSTRTAGRARALGDWRRRRLIAAGFDARLAGELAGNDAVDLHELLMLIDRGCPPALAARILAPLDMPGPPC
ncbi:MAG: hypothetical protein QOJ89_1502 [bacterium]|jgi:hypothetical protein